MGITHYVTHPEVVVDPDRPVPQWSLSDRGRSRAQAMLVQPWVGDVTRIVSSPETKALETAEIVAAHLGLEIEVRDASHELDRSATGFVPPDEHERLSDRCFASPHESVEGWEAAAAAQQRVADALADLLVERDGAADVLVIGHGGVGTFLWCRLAGLPIARSHDQPGQGHRWSYDRAARVLLGAWRPIDDPA